MYHKLIYVRFNDMYLLFLHLYDLMYYLLLIVLYFCMFSFESMQELILTFNNQIVSIVGSPMNCILDWPFHIFFKTTYF